MEVVTEFFGYSINRCEWLRNGSTQSAARRKLHPLTLSCFSPCSILYQRGIYPPESFASVPKYGLSILVTTDEGLKQYLAQVLRQLAEWLSKGEVQKLVVVITGVETREVLERWVFNIDTDRAALAPGCVPLSADRPSAPACSPRTCILHPCLQGRAPEEPQGYSDRDPGDYPANHSICNVPAAAGGAVHLRLAGLHKRRRCRPSCVGGERPPLHRFFRRGAPAVVYYVHSQGCTIGILSGVRG